MGNIKAAILFGIVLLVSAGRPLGALTPIGSTASKGHNLPFRLRGDLTTDFGWETPELAFRQNTELRLYTKSSIAQNISIELQVYLSYSNTDNQFTTSLRTGSYLDNATAEVMDLYTASLNNGGTIDDSTFSGLLDMGEIALNSRYIPQLSLFLDRANIKYRGRFADVTIGKQVVAWGSGYAWNPTDAINLRNPLDPTEPRKGVGAVVIDIPFREWFLLTMAMSPGKIIQESTEGVRAKFMTRWFDTAFSLNLVGSSERILMNGALEDAVGKRINTIKGILGFDFNTVLPWGINMWFESSLAGISDGDTTGADSAEVDLLDIEASQRVIGFQRVFFNKLRCILEFYHNSEGLSLSDSTYYDEDMVARNASLVALGDIGGLGRSYWALGLHYPFNPRWEATMILLKNSTDNSTAMVPAVIWNPRQDFKFSVQFNWFGGDKYTTEFGSFKNSTIFNFMYLF